MPVKLRLRRQGRKKAPHYSIVAADSRAPRDGKYIEKVGTYNPIKQPAQVYINHEAVIKWLGNGAQPTNTVRSILRHAGITLKYALIKQGKSEEEMDRIFTRWKNEKMRKSKQTFIMMDRLGNPLADWAPAAKTATEASAAEDTSTQEEKTETPVVEATPEAEVVEETAAVVEDSVVEAPAAEEVPIVEEVPVAEEAEAPAQEEEALVAQEAKAPEETSSEEENKE